MINSRLYKDLLEHVNIKHPHEPPYWFSVAHGIPFGIIVVVVSCSYILISSTYWVLPIQTCKPWLMLILLTLTMVYAALYATPSEMFFVTELHLAILFYFLCEIMIAAASWATSTKYTYSESWFIELTSCAFYCFYYIFCLILNAAHYEDMQRHLIHTQKLQDRWEWKTHIARYYLTHWDITEQALCGPAQIRQQALFSRTPIKLHSDCFWDHWRKIYEKQELAKKSIIKHHLLLDDLADIVIEYYLRDVFPDFCSVE